MSVYYKAGILLAIVSLLVTGCNNSKMRPGLSDTVRDYSNSLLVVPDIEGFGIDTAAGRCGKIV
ncbi:MAG: hypothetical protein KAH38_12075, partial [Candidatus Hydrogenedentes bacterium]|nr:hypothetical protein [Candidatus Hydrogenedentota bacterium]